MCGDHQEDLRCSGAVASAHTLASQPRDRRSHSSFAQMLLAAHPTTSCCSAATRAACSGISARQALGSAGAVLRQNFRQQTSSKCQTCRSRSAAALRLTCAQAANRPSDPIRHKAEDVLPHYGKDTLQHGPQQWMCEYSSFWGREGYGSLHGRPAVVKCAMRPSSRLPPELAAGAALKEVRPHNGPYVERVKIARPRLPRHTRGGTADTICYASEVMKLCLRT